MRHGTFSGILILDEGEDPAEFADFANADREVIDRLMQIGAVTHRHDAHPKLSDPTASAIVTVSDVGGMIPADTSFWVCYTLLDSYGGETLPSPAVTVTTDPALEAPTTELVGSASYTVGCLLADTYLYAISFVDAAGGETELGPAVAVEREPGFEFGEITISNLSADLLPGTSWRLYRNSGVSWDLLATGNDDLYLDDGFTVPDCNTNPPAEFNNGTNRTNRLSITVPEEAVPDDITGFRIYVSDDGSFESPCLFGEFIVADRGDAWPMPFPQFLGGRPPAVSQSIQGASKIDPDTDILDWHWKRPVATAGALPAGDEGDVRLALDSMALWGLGGDDEWVELGGDGAPEMLYTASGAVTANHASGVSSASWYQVDAHVVLQGYIEPDTGESEQIFALVEDPLAQPNFEDPGAESTNYVVASSDGPIIVTVSPVGEISFDGTWPDRIDVGGIVWYTLPPPLL